MTQPRRHSNQFDPFPQFGKKYPLKLGSSFQHNTFVSPREISIFKYSNIPESVRKDKDGVLVHYDDQSSILLPKDKEPNVWVELNAISRDQSGSSTLMLVFYQNQFWVENVSDYFYCRDPGSKHDVIKRDMNVGEPGDDPEGDPDSWKK